MNESKLILGKETFTIRGAGFEVYKKKGSGFVEPVYQECLELEFVLSVVNSSHSVASSHKDNPGNRELHPSHTALDKGA